MNLSSVQANLGLQIATEVQKSVVRPAFDAMGRITQAYIETITTLVIDLIEHHPRTYAKRFENIDLIINELATRVNGHSIRLTVIFDPEDKMVGRTFESAGNSAAAARNNCESCIVALVKHYYKV